MGFILSPFAGLIWDRKELRETEPPPQLVSAKVTETAAGHESVGIRPLGAEMSGVLAAIAYPRRPRAAEQKPKFAGSDAASTIVARRVAETQFDRVVDGPASDRVVATPGRGVRERL